MVKENEGTAFLTKKTNSILEAMESPRQNICIPDVSRVGGVRRGNALTTAAFYKCIGIPADETWLEAHVLTLISGGGCLPLARHQRPRPSLL